MLVPSETDAAFIRRGESSSRLIGSPRDVAVGRISVLLLEPRHIYAANLTQRLAHTNSPLMPCTPKPLHLTSCETATLSS